MVFLSEKSLFSIDMYVADVATGRISRKLVETTSDPHFDSLQFIASAGDWAPDNRRFVFAALHAGQPVLTIVDASNGNREGEYEFKDLGEIYNPAFSPDGKQIAFSALKGGVLDLFVYTLESGALQQLTNDPFADLDPEWSPDGREIVWVTDRFSSNLDTLSFGNYRHRRDDRSDVASEPRGSCARLRVGPQLESGVRRRTARCISSPRRTASRTCIGCRMRCAADQRRASPTSCRA